MADIETTLWHDIVMRYLVADIAGKLSKKQQQALANSLQEWAARCIYDHLLAVSGGDLPPKWEVHSKGRDFLGGLRPQEVDV